MISQDGARGKGKKIDAKNSKHLGLTNTKNLARQKYVIQWTAINSTRFHMIQIHRKELEIKILLDLVEENWLENKHFQSINKYSYISLKSQNNDNN